MPRRGFQLAPRGQQRRQVREDATPAGTAGRVMSDCQSFPLTATLRNNWILVQRRLSGRGLKARATDPQHVGGLMLEHFDGLDR